MNCKVQGCPEPARSKGLCRYCHRVAARDVKQGRVTWEDLYAIGLAVPAMRPRGPDHRFRIALREAVARQREATLEALGDVVHEVAEAPAKGRKRLAQRR